MFTRLKCCFSGKISNPGRQTEIDVAKGFAIIFMVLCHVFEMLSNWSSWKLEVLLDCILGGPFAAAVFMFCMGVGICYSQRTEPRDLFLRGCHLLAVGFVLEFIRDIIPYLIRQARWGVTPVYDGILSTVDVDILQFAGLFFLIYALLRKMHCSPRTLLLLALIFSVTGQQLRHVRVENVALNYLCGYIWRSHHAVWFPFLNWFIFPCAGILFGNHWRHCSDKKRFYRTITPAAWGITVLYLLLTYPEKGIYDHGLYYGIGIADALLVLVLILAMLGFCYFFADFFPRITHWLCWMSQNINELYCVHWTIISYFQLLLQLNDPDRVLPNALVIPVGFIILAASCAVVFLYNKIRRPKQ